MRNERYLRVSKKIKESIVPFAVLFSLFVFLAWLIVKPLGGPLLWSAVLSYFAYPFYKGMYRKLFNGRYANIAAGVTTASILIFMAIPMLIMCLYPLLMTKFGTVSLGAAYTAILGFFLLGCANLAIGVFISSLTESQVIAAVLTFVILFAFYMMNGISSFFSEGALSTCVTFGLLILAAAIIIYTMIKNFLISAVICVVGEIALVIVYVVNSSFFSGGIQKILDIFNLSSHFDNFANAIFDVKGILYFLSVIAVCLFLTVQSIAKRRWN